MASAPLTIPMSEELKAYVEARADGDSYGTPSEYIPDDRDRRLVRLEDELIEASKGPFIEITEDEWEHADIMAIAKDRLSQLK